MKSTKKCPKCGGGDIYFIPGTINFKENGRNIAFAKIMGFDAIEVDRYICGGCGYSEEYVSGAGLVKIKKAATSSGPVRKLL